MSDSVHTDIKKASHKRCCWGWVLTHNYWWFSYTIWIRLSTPQIRRKTTVLALEEDLENCFTFDRWKIHKWQIMGLSPPPLHGGVRPKSLNFSPTSLKWRWNELNFREILRKQCQAGCGNKVVPPPPRGTTTGYPQCKKTSILKVFLPRLQK